MSYREYYNETITVSGTKSYTYPASESGGSGSVTVYIDVPINIEIDVDTVPFDQSVDKAENHIIFLTETVVASEAAEVLAINESADKISGSIVNGFFSYIRYDISQQISEYRPLVEAKFIELIKLQESCTAKKSQMRDDFSRIAERYANIFHDLDRETNNRIKALNHAAFTASAQISEKVTCSADNGLFNTATVSNLEGANASALLFSSGIKNRTYHLIKKARRLLLDDKNLKTKLKSILGIHGTKNSSLKFLPVIFTETENESHKQKPEIKYDNDFKAFQHLDFKTLIAQSLRAESFNWARLNGNTINHIETFMQAEIALYEVSENHKNRVAEKIWQLWNVNKTTLHSNQNYV